MPRPPHTGFYLSDIPAAMPHEGWPVGAKLMKNWFARREWVMPTPVKRGQRPPPPRAIDTTGVTMAWAMRVPRFAAARQTLLATGANV